MERFLIQQIESEKGVIDLAFLKSVTFIESIDLDTPALKLEFYDSFSVIQDEVGLQTEDILRVTLRDHQLAESLDQTFEFIVLAAKTEVSRQEFFSVECLDTRIYALTERGFLVAHEQSIESVLRQLASEIKQFAVDAFPIEQDWHLIHARKTTLLRQMMKEMGALCFLSRETLQFRSLENLFAQIPLLEFEAANSKAEHQILEHQVLKAEWLTQDQTHLHFQGWDIEEGVIASEKYPEQATRLSPVSSALVLGNLSKSYIPALSFLCLGRGELRAGIILSLKWNTHLPERPIDESKPSKILVSRVSHFEEKNRYLCRVSGVVLQEEG